MLFVYGTLLFPEVLQAVLGRVPDTGPATLAGWRAAALPGRPYPGLVADPAATTAGRVLAGLSEGEWAVLDTFEGDGYERRPVVLRTGGRVWTYVWRDPAGVAAHDWDPVGFAATALPAYVDGCVEWRQALS